ncbi:hypothetical protein TWF481_009236 [Arthrobotrys musiformis]|uniref:Uncharacterized protein n=1 Tax=Arthrobotrys musiformis TaxID=47236 RepID=A0AAV9W359_9PEZI
MCITTYRFVGCRRVNVGRANDHIYILHRQTNIANAVRCGCTQTRQVWGREACPFCLKQILLQIQLQQTVLDEAESDEDVELDYRLSSVFYDSDDPNGKMSPKEADEKRAQAQARREERYTSAPKPTNVPGQIADGSDQSNTLETVVNELERLGLTTAQNPETIPDRPAPGT